MDESKIERYLREEMDPVEKKDFEKALVADTELAREVDLMKIVMTNITRQGDDELKNQIARIHQKMKDEGIVSPSNRVIQDKRSGDDNDRYIIMKRVLAAAAAVLLIGFFVAYLINGENELNSQLFQAYFKADTDQLDPILDELLAVGLATADQEKNEELAAVLAVYGQGQYAKADTAIKRFIQNYPDEPTALYYNAILDIHMKRWAEGSKQLESLSRSENAISREKIRWYLALSYLGSGWIEGAETILTDLEKGKSEISERAKLLLDELK